MTSPDGANPTGAQGLSTLRPLQLTTEADARTQMKSGAVGASGTYTNAQNKHNDNVRAPLQDQRTVSVTTIPYNASNVVRSIYLTSGTWSKPVAPAGKRIVKIGFACINGGTGGPGSAPGQYGFGRVGGLDGGFVYREYRPEDVADLLQFTVGAGGAGSAAGGASSGTAGGDSIVAVSGGAEMFRGRAGTSSITTMQGAVATSCRPGQGGAGGPGTIQGGSDTTVSVTGDGQAGQGTALANGGIGGSAGANNVAGGDGANGSAASSDPQIVSGGGGGGGGGGGAQASLFFPNSAVGKGGNGGAPGGGGGAAGDGPSNKKAGGNGANGACIAWVYLEDIPA